MKNDKQKLKKLRRGQLDQLYKTLGTLSRADMPSGAWIRDVRGALGMSATQMARILEIAPPTLKKLETSESKHTIEIKTLERLAAAMNCRLVYAIVPEPGFGSLEAILKKRARDVAAKIVGRVSQTMALEAQSLTVDERNQQIEETAEELIRTLDKRLWDEA
jgi:predicted DNA-binding mobile mystery protein A